MRLIKIATIITTAFAVFSVALFTLHFLDLIIMPDQLAWTLYFPITFIGAGLAFVTSPLGLDSYLLLILAGLLNLALVFLVGLIIGYIYNLLLKVVKPKTLNISIIVLVLIIIVFSYYSTFIGWLLECVDDHFC